MRLLVQENFNISYIISMSDLWSNSIIASPLYRELRSKKKESIDEFLFVLNDSPSPFSKHFHSQKPDIGINQSSIPNTKITFTPPRYGLSAIWYFKVVIASTANVTLFWSGVLGLIKDSVKISAGTNVLENFYPDAIMNEISLLSDAERKAVMLAIGSNTALVASTPQTFYIPLYTSFSKSPSNFLDMSFIEELQVSFTINSGAGIGSGAVIQSLDIALQIQSVIPEPFAYRALKEKQFSKETPLSLLWTSEYKETAVSVVSSGTTVSFTDVLLKCNKLCNKTIVQVYDVTVPGAYFPIQSLEFSTMNEIIYSGDTTELTVMGKRPWNNFLHSTDGSIDCCYEMNYDLYGSDLMANGGLGFKNLNTPLLNVTAFGVQSGHTYVLSVIHKYYNAINISPADGSIMRGLDV